ncbi:Beta-1,3-galactosyl-O-glycosyl-glycoprotein beta-1,6-N-acetylglucosaminyltransferase [Aphelenchoides besseyi]|nr:Beta-1,3-galactosyl-O-glycosyl-glycoprotein beta-1,6-N-acetylglucosaminyltransferase [Aphelenchoides besseyi]
MRFSALKFVSIVFLVSTFLIVFVFISNNQISTKPLLSIDLLQWSTFPIETTTVEEQLPIKQNSWADVFVSNLSCDSLFEENAPKDEIARLKKWKYSDQFFLNQMGDTNYTCDAIRETFGFNTLPLSQEEADYSLAYGMIVYKNLAQLYFVLSAIYHPQNAYCIAIDGKSSKHFRESVLQISKCFPNIIVINEGPIKWCTKSILEALYVCFQELTFRNHPWRYYQYITGFDLPLKTNLEMVRIFKQLNGTNIAEITVGGRIRSAKRIDNSTRLSVRKAGMSALISREAADAALKMPENQKAVDEVVTHIYNKSGSVYHCCSDELFWTTVFGNKQTMFLPGSFDAENIMKAGLIKKFFGIIWSRNITAIERTYEEPFPLQHYNIGRYQVWSSKNAICRGKYKASSCVYGLGDLPILIRRAELIAHKFHMDVEPAAFFCLWKQVRDRAFDPPQKLFRGLTYRSLPHVQLHHGKTIKELYLQYDNRTL